VAWLEGVMRDHPLLFFAIAWGWIALWILGSIVFRTSRGKPIVSRLPQGALYTERSASGRSSGGFLRSLGGASRCLLVGVTHDELIVAPRFPFTLMFLPEIYGLEYRLPRRSVRAELRKGVLHDYVRLSLDTDPSRGFELRLDDPERFLAALASSR